VAKSYYHRGCARCSLKQYAQAIADFTQVIRHNAKAGQTAQEGDASLSDEQTDSRTDGQVLDSFKRIETYIHRGNAHRHLGNHAEALADLTQGVERSGGSAQSYGCRGLLRLDMEDFAGAIADFDRTLAMHPTFAQGYLWRGFAWLRSEQPSLAMTDLTRAIEAIPSCAEAYNHRGVAYFYLNEFQAALADFDRAIRLDWQFIEAYNNRGNLRYLVGDRAAAAVDFDTAISLATSLGQSASAELHFNRAAALCATQEVADIAADYDHTVGLSGNTAAFYRHRAKIRAEQGHLSAAISDYTAAIEISPNAFAHYHRGRALASLGDWDEALADFDGAIALSPDYALPYCDRAQLRFKLNDLEGALADANQALVLKAPHRKEIFTNRCLTQFALGQPQKAMEDFNKLMDLALASADSSSAV
ncbi:MAG: tetratricopeptide repeat protein, partial [Cyanobacteria bacterium P01_F01_bin.53]